MDGSGDGKQGREYPLIAFGFCTPHQQSHGNPDILFLKILEHENLSR